MIKPIETLYNGYRFRSRLEARWAVFFDSIGIRFMYELQGFRLSDSTLYLPDFWLPDFNIYVEIKPSRDMDDGKAEKFGQSCGLTDAAGGIIVCYGDPMDENIRFITGNACDDSGGGSYDTDNWEKGNVFFTRSRAGELFVFVNDWKDGLRFVNAKHVYASEDCPLMDGFTQFDIERAKEKARAARFEHGAVN